MTRMTFDLSDVEMSGDVKIDLDLSNILEDLSADSVMEAVIEQFGYSDVISEMDTDEILGEIDGSDLFSHICNDTHLATDCITALWNDNDARPHMIEFIAEHVLEFCEQAKGHDELVNEVAWKALMAAHLGAQVGLALKPAPGAVAKPEPVMSVEWQEMESRKLALAKLDALTDEIRKIKESINADPHKA